MENLDLQMLFQQYVMPWSINIVMALLVFFIGRIIVNLLSKLIEKLLTRSKMDKILVNFVISILRSILLLFVVIAALDQLGVDTTSLIALLGAAGLAIGLALQDSLKNFAAGVMLIVFRPFKAGDFIEAGGTAGVVESISIFSSTLRSPDNKEVIVPNGAIYGDTITNFSARNTRRIDMVFGIGYDDDLRRAKAVLQELVDAEERILKEPSCLIAVSELGDSSVNFVVRPWVKSSDFWGVKFAFTEAVKLRFDDEGISIPYPQMDIHIDQPEKSADPA